MTRLLEHAVARLRDLRPEVQDALALTVLNIVGEPTPLPSLDYDTRAAITGSEQRKARADAGLR